MPGLVLQSHLGCGNAVAAVWLRGTHSKHPKSNRGSVYTGHMCKDQSQIFGKNLSGPIVSVLTVPSLSQLLNIILGLIMIQDSYRDRGNSTNTQKARPLSTSVVLSFL